MLFLRLAAFGVAIYVYAIILLSGSLHHGAAPWISALLACCYCVLLSLWSWHRGKGRGLGLCVPTVKGVGDVACMAALLALPLYNAVAFGLSPIKPYYALLMVGVAVTEELLFRGYLLRFFCQRSGGTSSALGVGVVFALFHLISVADGLDPFYCITQAVYALGAGTAFSGVRLRWGSIWPCVAVHYLVNLTGDSYGALSERQIWCTVAVGALFVIYGTWLCRGIKIQDGRFAE